MRIELYACITELLLQELTHDDTTADHRAPATDSGPRPHLRPQNPSNQCSICTRISLNSSVLRLAPHKCSTTTEAAGRTILRLLPTSAPTIRHAWTVERRIISARLRQVLALAAYAEQNYPPLACRLDFTGKRFPWAQQREKQAGAVRR